MIFTAGLEDLQELLHDMNTLRRMRVLCGAANDRLRPCKNAFFAMREIPDYIMLIYKGQA